MNRRRWTDGHQQTVTVLLLAAHCGFIRSRHTGAVTSENGCPNGFWGEPARRCSESLHVVLEEINGYGGHYISAEQRLNKTCHAWDRTNACYQRLIHRCQDDVSALRKIRAHIGRYVTYSLPCHDPELRYRKTVADCFLPEVASTRRCTDAVDRYLYRFVVVREFRSACRIINTAIKCFHDVKSNIRRRCRQVGADLGADQYHVNYIQPLVEQTRDTVLTHCSLSSPYKEYFINAPPGMSAVSACCTPGVRRLQYTPVGFLCAFLLVASYHLET